MPRERANNPMTASVEMASAYASDICLKNRTTRSRYKGPQRQESIHTRENTNPTQKARLGQRARWAFVAQYGLSSHEESRLPADPGGESVGNYPSMEIYFFSGNCGFESFFGICSDRMPCSSLALISSSVISSPT